jgi:phosphate butyryltransferase
MYKSFQEIEEYVLSNNVKKTIALAGAHDYDALSAVIYARRKGVVDAILVGREAEIKKLLVDLGEQPDAYEIINVEADAEIANTACCLVAEGKADIPMKGIIHTSAFMRGILNKSFGFVPDKALISHATVFEYTDEQRLMLLTDCVINIAPDYNDKVKIVNNAVKLAHSLGNPCPKVAVVAPVEVINPVMQSTIDAAMLSKAAQRGQIKGCQIDGPLGLDNAVSLEAARHKGIESDVAGVADILLMPDIAAGNIFTKSLTYFAKFPTAGAVIGTNVPVVMTSRTDKPQDKFHSILTAIMQVVKN